MNKKFQYISFGLVGLFLVSIGIIIDRVGGVAIRTDNVSPSIALSFSEPALLGVPFMVRWEIIEQQNSGVTMQLISGSETFVLGNGQLLAGAMSVVIPCTLPPAPFRLELVDVTFGAILGASPVDTLPPGPDCVR